jgi:hypothetical protein
MPECMLFSMTIVLNSIPSSSLTYSRAPITQLQRNWCADDDQGTYALLEDCA